MSYLDPNAPGALAFRCPICRSGMFQDVTVTRESGKEYRTDFLQCAGCSVMFRDAVKFTKFEPSTPKQPSAAEQRREAKRREFFASGEGD